MMRGAALALAFLVAGCRGETAPGAETAAPALTAVTIANATGAHVFRVERVTTVEAQRRGLMFRTDIPKDGGMLFDPYPAEGGGPREASFWMKDTPTPLDILYIRADRTIARIVENSVPFSEELLPSGEPIAAVLEINGGRAAELGIATGDSVRWTAK